MEVGTLVNLAFALLVAAGILMIVSIILFFKLRIMAVIGELSGITARRAIRRIRRQSGTKPRRGRHNFCRNGVTSRQAKYKSRARKKVFATDERQVPEDSWPAGANTISEEKTVLLQPQKVMQQETDKTVLLKECNMSDLQEYQSS